MLVSTGFTVITTDKAVADSDFLYYYLTQNNIVDSLHAIGEQSVSAYPSIKPSDIEGLELLLPPFEEQVEIGRTLRVLDEKIAENAKINHHLEQMAQAIYAERFSGYEPNGVLGDYCSVKSGYAFKSSWWQEKGVKVIKIKNINNTGLDLNDCSFVSADKIAVAQEFIARTGDLLIAMTGATIGKFTIIAQIDEVLLVNQRVGKFFFKDAPVLERLPFLWCTLRQESVFFFFFNRGQGSAQPNISPTDIMTIPIFMPLGDELINFNQALQSSFESITANLAENTRLAALRDTLLPRLMSGELSVAKATAK
jgi:type I restriction enzyme S subunit